MELVMVYPLDPTCPGGGGGVRYVMNLVRFLTERNVKTTLLGVRLNVDSRGTAFGPLFVPVVSGTDSWWIYYLGLFVRAPTLRLSDQSIVHAHRTYFLLPFILLKRNSRRVCTLHMKPLEFVRVHYPRALHVIDGVHKLIEWFCLKNTDLVIAVNSDVGEAYCNRYPALSSRLTVVAGSSVNLELFRPMNQKDVRFRHGFEPTEKVVMYVGRIEKIKNLELLIRAFAIVRTRMQEASLSIVGSGGDLRKLRSLAETLDISDSIRFHGEVEAERIPELMNCADVIALTSISESSPTVPREALACGIPVVSVRVGDIGEVICDEFTGRLVGSDEKEFAEAVVDVLTASSSLRDFVAKRCREKSMEFDSNRLCGSVMDCYGGLLVGRQS